jgi:hypothetical protein
VLVAGQEGGICHMQHNAYTGPAYKKYTELQIAMFHLLQHMKLIDTLIGLSLQL